MGLFDSREVKESKVCIMKINTGLGQILDDLDRNRGTFSRMSKGILREIGNEVLKLHILVSAMGVDKALRTLVDHPLQQGRIPISQYVVAAESSINSMLLDAGMTTIE